MPTNLSVYPALPADPNALVFTPEAFGACPDGIGDNSPALQSAIDRIQSTLTHGILFVPSGTYRLSGQVDLWRGIRLIGFGPTRPIFLLGENTPGYQHGQERYMIFFRDRRPPVGEEPIDAQNTTFYSGIRNIDFEIREGNPAAIALRYRVAQLSSLEYIEFRIGSGLGAIEATGNQIQHCVFRGGEFGIRTDKTSPWWQALVADCLFEGQRRVCVDSHDAGLTMLRCAFRDAPEAVTVPEMKTEQLFMKDCRMERIPRSGVSMSLIRHAGNHLNLINISCSEVPLFFDIQRKKYNPHLIHDPIKAPSTDYVVEDMHAGLSVYWADGRVYGRKAEFKANVRPVTDGGAGSMALWQMPDGLTALPPMPEWINVRTCGARGDGFTDDTEAFRKAIETGRVVYVPTGRYLVTDTIRLRSDTGLIGLHCHETMFVMPDHTKGFDDPHSPKAMFEIPRGADCQVRGIGIDAGYNRGSIAFRWLGSPRSLMEDVYFDFGGTGRASVKGTGRMHALLVEDGGAGVFQNVWIPDVLSRDGLHVRNTSTPGQIWLMSVEHHEQVECVFDHVRNWLVCALQTEEDTGSEYALSLRLADCEDLVFTNLFQYRIMSIDIRHPYASYVERCREIRFRGVHIFSQGATPFDDMALVDGAGPIGEREAAYVRFE